MGLPTRADRHTKTTVTLVPRCDLPHDEMVLAYADARMVRNAGRRTGSWASLCKEHFDEFGCELGLGKGQEYVFDAPPCQHCGRVGGH